MQPPCNTGLIRAGVGRKDMTIGRRGAVLGGAGAFAGTLALGQRLARAQDITFFRIGTGGTAGTYFPIGGLIANAISNPPGSRPCSPVRC